MMDISLDLLHYGVIATVIASSSIGVGISQGWASLHALNAMNRQPSMRGDIFKTVLIGMTLIETVAIVALLLTFLLFMGYSPDKSYYAVLSELGIAAALSLSGIVISCVSAMPVIAACAAIVRQPFYTQKIFSLMLMTQVLIQTPIITALIVGLLIHSQSLSVVFLVDSCRLIASGLAIGLGCIGPAIGLGLFAQAAISGVGRNPSIYNKLLPFTFISQAIIETPIIFCLIISVILLFIVPFAQQENLLHAVIYITASLCIGLGTLGAGISSGLTGSAACKQIVQKPEEYNLLSRTSMLAQGIIETIVIYSVVLSFIMILFK